MGGRWGGVERRGGRLKGGRGGGVVGDGEGGERRRTSKSGREG